MQLLGFRRDPLVDRRRLDREDRHLDGHGSRGSNSSRSRPPTRRIRTRRRSGGVFSSRLFAPTVSAEASNGTGYQELFGCQEGHPRIIYPVIVLTWISVLSSSPKRTSQVVENLVRRVRMVALKGVQEIAAQETRLVKMNIGLGQRHLSRFMIGSENQVETVRHLEGPAHSLVTGSIYTSPATTRWNGLSKPCRRRTSVIPKRPSTTS